MRGAAAALAVVLLLAGCGGEAGPGHGNPPAPVLVVLPAGAASTGRGIPEARVEVSADPESRERGLMGRAFLRPDEGMLFVYPSDGDRHFWMKDCAIPLSAAFLDAGGRILNIEEMAPGAGRPEEELRTWDSAGPARYVLEMEGGWFAGKGIAAGDLVDLAPALRGVVPR